MKKLELFVIVLLITSALYSQNTQVKKFSSRELNDDRFLKIYVPPGYADDKTKLYPLTIVLDAE